MKDISVALKTHFAGEITTYAIFWQITRTDATIMGFTSHNNDIIYDGVVYEAATGFTPSSVAESSGLKVDNLEVQSILDSARITVQDIEAGIYDYSDIKIFLLNYEDLTQGEIILKTGNSMRQCILLCHVHRLIYM